MKSSPTGAAASAAKTVTTPKAAKPPALKNTNTAKAAPTAPATTPVLTADLTPTPGPLTLVGPTGIVYTSNEPTLIQCCFDIAGQQSKNILAVVKTFNRADAQEYLKAYSYNRPISTNNCVELTGRMDSGDWAAAWGNLAVDTSQNPVNGAHTLNSFINSKLETIDLGIVLGVDPRMRVRIDTGLDRDLVAQGCYLVGPAYNGIDRKIDRRSFVSATSTLFEIFNSHKMHGLDLSSKNAKKLLCKHAFGERLLYACNPVFKGFTQLIETEVNNNNEEIKALRHRVFYLPALIMNLSGHGDLVEPLAIGADLKRGDYMLMAHSLLIAKVSTREEGAIRRDQSEVLLDVAEILELIYARITNTRPTKVLRPPRFSAKSIGLTPQQVKELKDWEAVTEAAKRKSSARRKTVMRFFLDSIKL